MTEKAENLSLYKH